MSQPPFPPQPTPYPAPPRKPRPRFIWFVVGGALLVLAPIVFVGALFLALGPLVHSDGVFPADGSPHELTVSPGEKRALFVPVDSATATQCQVADGSGRQPTLKPVIGSYTTTSDGQEFAAVSQFDSGDGHLTITCSSADDARVRVGKIPSIGSFVAGIGIGIVGPLLLGTAGLVILIVTGILYATRPPRSKA